MSSSCVALLRLAAPEGAPVRLDVMGAKGPVTPNSNEARGTGSVLSRNAWGEWSLTGVHLGMIVVVAVLCVPTVTSTVFLIIRLTRRQKSVKQGDTD